VNEFMSSEGYAAAYRSVPERFDPMLRELLAQALAMHPYLAVALNKKVDVDMHEEMLKWSP
jgi:hypothetical protein